MEEIQQKLYMQSAINRYIQENFVTVFDRIDRAKVQSVFLKYGMPGIQYMKDYKIVPDKVKTKKQFKKFLQMLR